LASGVAYGLSVVAYPTLVFIVPFLPVFLAFALGRRAVAMVAEGSFVRPPDPQGPPTGNHAWMIVSAWALGLAIVLVPASLLIAGFGIAGGDDPKAHFTAGVGLGYYLNHSNISPYLGASFGIFAGSRVDGEERSSDDVGFDYDDDEDDVAVGFELCPVFGVEFMRHSSIRVHFDFKYSFSVVTDSRYGHGLVALIGINF